MGPARAALAALFVAAVFAAGPGREEAAWAADAPPPSPPAHDARVDALIEKARALHIADTPAWRRLGHYRSGLFGAKSEVDGAPFFLAATGKRNPEAELEATLAALFAPVNPQAPDEHAMCRFPARLLVLMRALAIDPGALPSPRCTKFQSFVERLKPAGVTLVFSSYYLNNPASAFGHTFLRIDSAEALGGVDLLQYGVDYAATVNEPNAFLYAVKGLFGVFPGQFKAMPYYYKVREYNDFESRDLWEYRLRVTPMQVLLLVAHLWELGATHIDYWYIDENCSYHILGALEAALPDRDLLARLRVPVLPAETVRAVAEQPDLVVAIKHRPSSRLQLRARWLALSRPERRLVLALADNSQADVTGLSLERQVRVFDTAADLLDLRYARELIAQASEPSERKRQLLTRRAALAVASPPVEIGALAGQPPHTGHGASRVSLGGGYTSAAQATLDLDFRLALHDLTDADAGYPATAQIEFLPFRLSYRPTAKKLALEDAAFVRIVSLSPLVAFERRFSWKFRIGATTLRDRGCGGACLVGVVELGSGATVGFFGDRLLLFAMADTQVASGPGLDGAGVWQSPVRVGVGPSGGFRLQLGQRVMLVPQAQWLWLPGQTPRQTVRADSTLRLALSPSWALAVQGVVQPRDAAALGLVSAYY